MSIVQNRRARHEYFIEEVIEAGLVLEGWEVKAIRERRAQLAESYVIVRDGELWVIGMHISPLPTTSTHIHADPTRSRKLLLHRHQINKLIGQVEQRGFTLIPLNLHFSRGRIKMDVGLAKGKKQHDKRQAQRERDWKREQQRILRNVVR